jgi:phospholipid transport system substrate-binding protein
MKKFVFLFFFLIGLTLTAQVVYSQLTPVDTIQPAVNNIIEILRNNKLDSLVKREKIKGIIYKHFDLEETAKRVMGANWRQLSPEQQNKFTGKFKELMENSYVNKIDAYADEEVILNKTQIQDRYAKVDGIIKGKANDIPISFIMLNKNSSWMVYDFIVENVSLVSNYRTTYNQVFTREGFSKLMEEMDKKITELKNTKF